MTAWAGVIRVAILDDRDALYALIHDHAAYERAEASLTLSMLDTVMRMDEPPVQIFVAVDGGSLDGFAAVTLDYSLWRAHRWAHLDCLFVRQAVRGQSIGRKLLAAACNCAREWGADRLEWQTPVWNTRAIEFYRRMGASDAVKQRFGIAL